MLQLDELSHIGFGAYRISVKSRHHRAALSLALQSGCTLIDTASNYTDGDSERLIGEVLADHPEREIFIISKCGHIQGHAVKRLEELLASRPDRRDIEREVVRVHDALSHCMHPVFIHSELSDSLKRMKRSSLDAYLIHNPEYFFESQRDPDEYYRRIRKAFECLEQEVKNGRIRYYGISSNNFVLPPNDPTCTDIRRIVAIAKSVNSDHHCRFIEFPFNFLETGAIDPHFDGKTLLDIATENHIRTLSNRPLNAFRDDGPMRLATYEFLDQNIDESDARDIYRVCLARMQEKLSIHAPGERIEDTEFIRQFSTLWYNLPTTDAVDQVFMGNFFPFIMELWNGESISSDEAKPFYLLYDTATVLSRKQMTTRAHHFHMDLIDKGILEDNGKPLSHEACHSYLQVGISHVLVGMRRAEYVEQLRPLF